MPGLAEVHRELKPQSQTCSCSGGNIATYSCLVSKGCCFLFLENGGLPNCCNQWNEVMLNPVREKRGRWWAGPLYVNTVISSRVSSKPVATPKPRWSSCLHMVKQTLPYLDTADEKFLPTRGYVSRYKLTKLSKNRVLPRLPRLYSNNSPGTSPARSTLLYPKEHLAPDDLSCWPTLFPESNSPSSQMTSQGRVLFTIGSYQT